MNTPNAQSALFDSELLFGLPSLEAPEPPSPASEWERKAAQRALDDLFANARQYHNAAEQRDLFNFVARFRFYSPYNAMLVHIQMPGAGFVAPAWRWKDRYRRSIKTGARPLVILQPMGPVMFVFDVSDTEPMPEAPPLPREATHPFEPPPGGRTVGRELETTILNAIRDGVKIHFAPFGSQQAGSVQQANKAAQELLLFPAPTRKDPQAELIVLKRYEMLLNKELSREARYGTIVHELAHLYCGHIGTPNQKSWPDRRGLDKKAVEIEAESVAYLVCQRLGVATASAEYLAGYWEHGDTQLPSSFSLELVMKAAGLIESMGRERLRPRPKENLQ